MAKATTNEWKGKDRMKTDVVLKPEETRPNDIIIPIMGPPGVGKSTFINAAVGKPVALVGHGLESCTKDLQHIIIPYPADPSRRVVLLDTPSFDGTYSEDPEILRRIGVWLAQSYHNNMKIAGIIYLHEIHQTAQASYNRNLMVIRKLCGTSAMKNLVLTTTKWPNSSDDTVWMQKHSSLTVAWKDLIDQGCKTAQFRNTRESAWDVIDLVVPNPHLPLQIQQELVDLAKRIPETEAGRSLRNIVLELVRNGDESEAATQKRLKEAKKEILSALKDIPKLEEVPTSKRLRAFFYPAIRVTSISSISRFDCNAPEVMNIITTLSSGFHCPWPKSTQVVVFSHIPFCSVMTAKLATQEWKGKDRKREDTVLKDGRADDIIVPIMGRTGVGKSSFINTLVGREATVVGHDLESCTATLHHVMVPYPLDTTRRVIFVDTPGFDDTNIDDAEILRRIGVWLASSYHDHMKVAGVIYLHDISQARVQTSRTTLNLFHKLCGNEAMKNVALATTKWSFVSHKIGEKNEKELSDNSWADMIGQGSQVGRFDDTQKSAWDLVYLVIQNDPLALQIQLEMIDLKRRFHETSAGRAANAIEPKIPFGERVKSFFHRR
ncbi:P-loop containing nucleoside triphosphate hydrolase protein [Hygrophoropsis aurantiaca]|uniref:P-loop containing nucleoside triphosphate hydrolase protein n=1 Tax=Hygrophoropsis aurantiaca TaxID=72124 RepID=A0ACB8AIH0_9AGAM|nr:P-loop containing nucleoside triphosphate hydrolase protein [Hygrophoropsis aurantiaca]